MKTLNVQILMRIRILLLVLILAACSANSNMPTSAHFTPQSSMGLTPNADATTPTQGFQANLANSRLVVGPNRFALGLIQNGRALKDAMVRVTFFDLNSGTPVEKNQADAPYYGDNLGEAGVYVTHTTFDAPGKWGAEVNAQQSGQAAQIERIGFEVIDHDTIPNVGEPAPRSKNLTLKEVGGDVHKLSSAVDGDDYLHTMTISEAVTSGKPSVILFATPAFCTSRTCGPSHQVVEALAQNYHDQVNFIHIEVYKDFKTFAPADAMLEWHLETEPWLFFVDKNGKIVERFEGGITTREIVPEFLKFIGG
jgi:hypothetical protein